MIENNITSCSHTNVPIKKKKPRCVVCNKKLGLMVFTCQCNQLFCITHLQPELHNCKYDHKTKQKEELEKSLPKVTAEKVIKI